MNLFLKVFFLQGSQCILFHISQSRCYIASREGGLDENTDVKPTHRVKNRLLGELASDTN